MSELFRRVKRDVANVVRGVCMGCADVVPGVSGGTVALILGIYQRLVTAISHVDATLLGHLRGARWRAAAEHLDLRFLICLAAGIGSGLVGMSLVIHRLLSEPTTRSLTFAAFFGMIFASALVVAAMIRAQGVSARVRALLLGLAAAALAYWISTLPQTQSSGSEPSYVYLFISGCVAICAMILPGISGAMILLLLGVYAHLTEIPHHLLHGEHVVESLLRLGVFGTGCAISLVAFSKFLRWLLEHYHEQTMAALCGFMFGALRKLWPFQEDLTPEIESIKEKQFAAIWPDVWDGQVTAVLVTAVIAGALVLVIERWTRQQPG